MKTLIKSFFVFWCNFFVLIANLFIWRNKRIWLFGSWMGERFADNSRFLFQYLSNNKAEYGIKKIIWATRNEELYSFLKKMNYFVVKVKSFKGFFYHLKSGVHVICNNSSSSGYKKDLNTFLSFGATKVQLWHGVGIKACGKLARKKASGLKEKISDRIITPFFQPGMWGNCFFLATSEENKRIAIDDYGFKPSRVIISQYPRLCEIREFCTDDENELIKKVNECKKIKILYLPTFRKNGDGFVFPYQIAEFASFLKANNLLWIQKSHSTVLPENNNSSNENVLVLNKDFDINVLLDCVDMVITDYSSVSTDAIFKNILTLEYCPDYKEYEANDRGFVNDFLLYHTFNPITSSKDLFNEIVNRLSTKTSSLSENKRVRDFLFEKQDFTMHDIVVSLINAFSKRGGVL